LRVKARDEKDEHDRQVAADAAGKSPIRESREEQEAYQKQVDAMKEKLRKKRELEQDRGR
jgi:hypothetical protein